MVSSKKMLNKLDKKRIEIMDNHIESILGLKELLIASPKHPSSMHEFTVDVVKSATAWDNDVPRQNSLSEISDFKKSMLKVAALALMAAEWSDELTP